MRTMPRCTSWGRHARKVYGLAFGLAAFAVLIGGLCGLRRGWFLGSGLIVLATTYDFVFSLRRLPSSQPVASLIGVMVVFISPALGFLMKGLGASLHVCFAWSLLAFIVGLICAFYKPFRIAQREVVRSGRS